MSRSLLFTRFFAALLGIAALVATGCFLMLHMGAPASRTGLPTLVNIIARLQPSGYVSLLVQLHAPRRRPSLRATSGIVSYDGRRLLEILPLAREAGFTADLRIQDLLSDSEVQVQVVTGSEQDVELDVMQLLERSTVVRIRSSIGERWVAVDTRNGALARHGSFQALERFGTYGPDRGFAVALQDEKLVLSLPDGERQEDIPLLDGVDGIVAVHWIPEQIFSEPATEELDRRFKMASTLTARAQTCDVDGDLGEWRSDAALGVGSIAQVQRGYPWWENERDASFAVATRLAPHALCAAVRVRDEELRAGEDMLVVAVDQLRYQLPIPDQPRELRRQGLRAMFTDQASFGIGLEFCVDGSLWESFDGHVPFRIEYHDHDQDQGVAVLASAPNLPWPALAGVRLPRRAIGGALPPR